MVHYQMLWEKKNCKLHPPNIYCIVNYRESADKKMEGLQNDRLGDQKFILDK